MSLKIDLRTKILGGTLVPTGIALAGCLATYLAIGSLDQSIQSLDAPSVTQADLHSLSASAAFIARCTIGGAITLLLAALFIGWKVSHQIATPLAQIMDKLSQSANTISESSEEVSYSSQAIAATSSELESTAASHRKLASMTDLNVDNARAANALMRETYSAIESASAVMEKMATSMQAMAARSVETQRIVGTIDEIAFQTNLLALNAAVEAARAGNAGAGFAVVADEVRSLAQRAAKAAQDTSHQIENSVRDIEDSAKQANDTRAAYASIAQNSSKVTDLITEIAQGAVIHSDQLSQANKTLSVIETVVCDNTSNAEKSAAIAQQMHAQAIDMNDIVRELDHLIQGESQMATYTPKILPHQMNAQFTKPTRPTPTSSPARTLHSPQSEGRPVATPATDDLDDNVDLW